MKTTIGLAMIVKNETKVLPRLAANLMPCLDGAVIVDTGSTDGTPELARELFKPVEGTVFSVEWNGFAEARNEALRIAEQQGFDWVLHMDADETIEGYLNRGALEADPSLDGYEAEIVYEGLRYWVPRLLRSSAGWQWHGRAHEYLAVEGQPGRLGRLLNCHVVHHADGGNRAAKKQRGLDGLRSDWRETVAPSRTAFYLARTYDDYNEPEAAAIWYRKRIEMGGWDEEVFYASWRLGVMLVSSRSSQARREGVGALWEAYSLKPHRVEPLWTLAEYHRHRQEYVAAWTACWCAITTAVFQPFNGPQSSIAQAAPKDRLFVHEDMIRVRMAQQIATIAPEVGLNALGRKAQKYLKGLATTSESGVAASATTPAVP